MAKNKRNGKPIKQDLEDQLKQFEQLLYVKLPREIMRIADLNLFYSFNREQYQDGKSSKWAFRKNDSESHKKRGTRRALLVKSGDLRNSVEVDQDGLTITIGTDKVYAQIHNEGLQGNAFGKHPFKMPKRQYMPIPGEAPPYLPDIENYLDNQMDDIFG